MVLQTFSVTRENHDRGHASRGGPSRKAQEQNRGQVKKTKQIASQPYSGVKKDANAGGGGSGSMTPMGSHSACPSRTGSRAGTPTQTNAQNGSGEVTKLRMRKKGSFQLPFSLIVIRIASTCLCMVLKNGISLT